MASYLGGKTKTFTNRETVTPSNDSTTRAMAEMIIISWSRNIITTRVMVARVITLAIFKALRIPIKMVTVTPIIIGELPKKCTMTTAKIPPSIAAITRLKKVSIDPRTVCCNPMIAVKAGMTGSTKGNQSAIKILSITPRPVLNILAPSFIVIQSFLMFFIIL